MLPKHSKRKRWDVSEGESSRVDIISNLPDSVLSHILSFLPNTREAVITSILSKRWRYVWTCVDKLVFYKLSCNRSFGRFVSNVLKLHKGNIKEFTLYCYECYEDKFDFTSWIDTAVARGVERMHVTTGSPFTCPLSVLSCKTLVELKISRLCDITMDIPSKAIFPCLKKLVVPLSGCDMESFKHMVSQCAALEHLIVRSDKDIIDIVSPSVKRLELHFPSCASSRQKVILGVPSLEYLQIYGVFPIEFIVEEQLSSLIQADICLCEPYSQNENVGQLLHDFVTFIQPLSNVKILRLDCRFRRFLSSVGHGLFLNLTNLEIVSNFFEWRLLVSLMESSTNLQAITMKKISTLKHKLAWKEPEKVPTCLSSSLRKISIDGYGFSEDELPMVKYVLRTAQVLERMDIYCSDDIIQMIQKLPKACVGCEISLLKKP